jgi:hypothetical protein
VTTTFACTHLQTPTRWLRSGQVVTRAAISTGDGSALASVPLDQFLALKLPEREWVVGDLIQGRGIAMS